LLLALIQFAVDQVTPNHRPFSLSAELIISVHNVYWSSEVSQLSMVC